jgi:hypothetical protein
MKIKTFLPQLPTTKWASLCLLLVAGFFGGCSQTPGCVGEDKNAGIISSSIEIGCEPTNLSDYYLIDSDSLYQQMFIDSANGQTRCTLPPIDFSNYTLLGARVSGQCEISVRREVTRLEARREYLYKIAVQSCGDCKKLAYKDNWVLVPTLPSGWLASFEVVED